MYRTKLLLLILDISEPGEGASLKGHVSYAFSPLNKAPLYLVCVPNKVKGEPSDVNIHFLLCVNKEVIRTSKGKRGRPVNEAKNLLRQKATERVGLRRIDPPGRGEEERADWMKWCVPEGNNKMKVEDWDSQFKSSPPTRPASIGIVGPKDETKTKHSGTQGHTVKTPKNTHAENRYDADDGKGKSWARSPYKGLLGTHSIEKRWTENPDVPTATTTHQLGKSSHREPVWQRDGREVEMLSWYGASQTRNVIPDWTFFLLSRPPFCSFPGRSCGQ